MKYLFKIILITVEILLFVLALKHYSVGPCPLGHNIASSAASTRLMDVQFNLFESLSDVRSLPGIRTSIANFLFEEPGEAEISIIIPDGRCFAHLSHFTEAICDTYGKLECITFWPSDHPESLSDTTKGIKSILAEWKIEPRDGIGDLLAEMREAEKWQNTTPQTKPATDPSVQNYYAKNLPRVDWSGDRREMNISADACIEIAIRPLIGMQDRYAVVISIASSRDWKRRHWFKHPPTAATQPDIPSGSSNSSTHPTTGQ